MEECPSCGELVRAGMVRCWKCNGFMREDIAKKYRDMTTRPQQIIYSEIPKEQRTEFLPARAGADAEEFRPVIFDADDDDFTLGDGVMGSSADGDGGFELGAGVSSSAPSAPQPLTT
ncbi:MAG: hypothetical protein KDA85_22365, partial [Planctomycetaceae bacterium]|nr:hypothetical protein [Planctomycetaceae bacterium]